MKLIKRKPDKWIFWYKIELFHQRKIFASDSVWLIMIINSNLLLILTYYYEVSITKIFTSINLICELFSRAETSWWFSDDFWRKYSKPNLSLGKSSFLLENQFHFDSKQSKIKNSMIYLLEDHIYINN
jgi:Leu/Phe-tRNA-protein transferase